VEDVTDRLTNQALKDQLEKYRKLVEDIPKKSHITTKALMISALKEAITCFKATTTT
jgi:hypothetical protein